MSEKRALLIDFGGCLTSAFFDAFKRPCRERGIRENAVESLLMNDERGHALLVDVERGVVSQTDFERGISRRLSEIEGTTISPDGFVRDLLRDLRPEDAMLQKLSEVRASGVLVGIISNSWGTQPYDPYAPWNLASIADDVILSDEVGLRKPDRAIWELSCERLGVRSSNCL